MQQLNSYLETQDLDKEQHAKAFEARKSRHESWRNELRGLESPSEDGAITVPHLVSKLRQSLPRDTVYVLEAVTNAGAVIHHLNSTQVCKLHVVLVRS